MVQLSSPRVSRARLRVVAAAAALGLPLSVLVAPAPAAAVPADMPPEHYVQPIDWDRFTEEPDEPLDGPAADVEEALGNATRYGLTTWWAERFGGQTGRYLELGGVGEQHIRQPAAEAYAIAVALQTGAYDADATGVPAGEARAMAVRLTTSIAHAHRVTTPTGWGDAWQSALWAYYAGNAAWLLWDDLPADDRHQVAAMLTFEADRFIGYEVPYFRDRDGTVVYPGDSKAEENAWNANLLQLVTAMLPRHPHSSSWMTTNVELMLSAFARPSDLENGRVLHGRAVRDWLGGSNIAEDGTLVNHGFVHPDYMATVAMNTSAPLTYALAGLRAPEASRFNADVVYAALSGVDFPSPPFDEPGGTIYVHDESGAPTDQIYYPQGNDWGTHRRAHFVVADASADAFDYDGQSDAPGATWEGLHVGTLLEMQARGTDGRTYQAPAEDTYAGRETWVAVEIARAHLVHWLDAHQAIRWTNEAYPTMAVDATAPDLLPAGATGRVEVELAPELTRMPATSVSLAAEASAGLSVDAEGPTAWDVVRSSGVATVLRVGAAADAAGAGSVTVRIRYLLAGRWQEARTTVPVSVVPPAPESDSWLSDLPWISATTGYGPALLDENYYGDPIGIDGTPYEKGVWSHAPASLTYFLGGRCDGFTAQVGIDDAMHELGPDRGSVVFQVRLDGELVADTGRVTGSMPAVPVVVDTSGAQVLRLDVTDAGDGKSHDHAVWAAAHVTCAP